MGICTSCYEDDKRQTCNSLLRVQTPYPQRTAGEELAVKVAGCACFPLKCLEGMGMMVCGAVMLPAICAICKIETHHEGTSVSVKKISPSCWAPHIPCHYKDTYYQGGQITASEGFKISCSTGSNLEGSLPAQTVVSSVTGYDCLSTGVGKVVNTLLAMACCPIQGAWYVCCKKD